jgi:hypothetical protein
LRKGLKGKKRRSSSKGANPKKKRRHASQEKVQHLMRGTYSFEEDCTVQN